MGGLIAMGDSALDVCILDKNIARCRYQQRPSLHRRGVRVKVIGYSISTYRHARSSGSEWKNSLRL